MMIRNLMAEIVHLKVFGFSQEQSTTVPFVQHSKEGKHTSILLGAEGGNKKRKKDQFWLLLVQPLNILNLT